MSRLPHSVRFTYGLGMAAEGVKNNAFNMFLLFFYQQVLGLDAVLCGVALFVALLVDAVTDPMVGVWSDRTRSRLGRRHPYMFASIAPLGLCFYAVFQPPGSLGQVALFVWLLASVVGTRVAMTLFAIPHHSLVAELSEDPGERVTLQSFRTAFAWLFGLLNAIVVLTVMLPPTDAFPTGLGNPDGYFGLALFGAGVMGVMTATSTVGTLGPTLRRQSLVPPTPSDVGASMRAAFGNPRYRSAVIAGLALIVAAGFRDALTNYSITLFWGLNSEQLALLVFGIMASAIAVMFTSRPLTARIGERRAGMLACWLVALTWPTMVIAKFAGWLPPPDNPWLLVVLGIASMIVYYGVILGMTMVGAMIADITDEHARTTGHRQEGLLFSAYAFVSKASSGVGLLFAGAALRAAGIPEGTAGTLDDPEAVLRLVGIELAVIAGLATIAMRAFAGYRKA